MKKNIVFVLLLFVLSQTAYNTENAAKNDKEAKKMILVVYYSRTGNTKKVAEDIAVRLNADIDPIIDTKDRSGFFGLMSSVWDAIKKKPAIIKEPLKNPSQYNLVILGTPIWGGTAALPVMAYIEKYKNSFNKIAYFCTAGGTSPKDTSIANIEALTGKKGIAGVKFISKELKPAQKEIYEKKLAAFITTLK